MSRQQHSWLRFALSPQPPAWGKAHEEGEMKRYGGSALFGGHWTMEKQLVPVGMASVTAKKPPSNALVSTHESVTDPVETNLVLVVLLPSG